jgi:hypothetical protein
MRICISQPLVSPAASNRSALIDGRWTTCASTAFALNTVLQLRCARRARAVDTTEDLSVRFDAMADDTAIAVWANRRQRVNCALEAIEGVTLSANHDFKRLVIFVLANFACRHT